MYKQNATHYPVAASDHPCDIIHAARARATHWGYTLTGPWNVTIHVGKSVCEVTHSPEHGYYCRPRGQEGYKLVPDLPTVTPAIHSPPPTAPRTVKTTPGGQPDASTFPAARSSDHSDIIDAANSRATFWGYRRGSSWNVTITVDKKICEVAHNAGTSDGFTPARYICHPRGGGSYPLNPTR